MIQINIVGQGTFGKFLGEIFKPVVEFSQDAEHVFLAVPIEAYTEVASQFTGKHLINVCSVQQESNSVCLEHSKLVTGIHPLFGPRSPKDNWSAVLTHSCPKTQTIVDLFEQVGSKVFGQLPDGRTINGELHDRMMADTHLAGLRQLENLKDIVEKAAWVPKEFIPTSFQRLQNFVEQSGDFSPGTLSSIQSNPYADDKK